MYLQELGIPIDEQMKRDTEMVKSDTTHSRDILSLSEYGMDGWTYIQQ